MCQRGYADLGELPTCELRRILIPQTRVNSPQPTPQGDEMSALGYSHKVCLLVSLNWGAAGLPTRNKTVAFGDADFGDGIAFPATTYRADFAYYLITGDTLYNAAFVDRTSTTFWALVAIS
jgi:hypothetical protein